MARAPIELESLGEEEVSTFLASFDTVLTDCDGVLWAGNQAIPGSPEVINLLRQAGKKVIYVTNNGTKSRKEYVKKCQDLGFGGDFTDIFTTSYLCAKYLQQHDFNKKVYLFGNKGVAKELDDANIAHTGSDPESEGVTAMTEVAQSVEEHMNTHGEEIGAVIATYNFNINVAKMAQAASYLDNPDVLFIGTNRDPKFPYQGSIVLPGTGAFIGAVEVASGREATILGKPEKFMFQAIKDTHMIDPARTIMVGDRCDTDILFGKNNALKTLMVGSGIHSLEEVLVWAKSDDAYKRRLVPDYFLSSLGKLMPFLKPVDHSKN